MRNVVSSLFISLDGVTDAPNQWQFEFDDQMGAAMTAEIAGVDTILLGRVTYEDWAQYWPTATDEPFASHMNKTPKIVVSTTLDKVQWGQWNTVSLIKSSLPEEIAKLKNQPGKDISVSGSPSLARSLLQSDLLDTLKLWVHPVVAGKGKHLFQDGDPLKRLKLVDSKVTSSGCAILTYQPVKS